MFWLMIGAWIAKRFVKKLDENQFRGFMEAVLFPAGISMMFGASI